MGLVRKWYLRLLWLRYSYPFRWAHKPLCDRHRADVFQFGRISLCRSCGFLYLGVVLTLSALVFSLVPPGAAKPVVLCSFLPLLFLSGPWIYKNLPRVIRDILRLWLGCSLALWGMLLVAGEFYSFAAVLFPAGAAYCYYYGKRKERKMAECASCPEYGTGKICSGYALQAELAREYEEKATNYLLATGYVPPSISNR